MTTKKIVREVKRQLGKMGKNAKLPILLKDGGGLLERLEKQN